MSDYTLRDAVKASLERRAQTKPESPAPAVGQVWADCDYRHEGREFEIIAIEGTYVRARVTEGRGGLSPSGTRARGEDPDRTAAPVEHRVPAGERDAAVILGVPQPPPHPYREQWRPVRFVRHEQACYFCRAPIHVASPGSKRGTRGTKAFFEPFLKLWRCLACQEEWSRAEGERLSNQSPKEEAAA